EALGESVIRPAQQVKGGHARPCLPGAGAFDRAAEEAVAGGLAALDRIGVAGGGTPPARLAAPGGRGPEAGGPRRRAAGSTRGGGPRIEVVVCSIATTYARSPLTSAERISHPADSKPVNREATQSKVAWVSAGPVADIAAPKTVTGSLADHSAFRGPASPRCRASSAAIIRSTSASMSSALPSTMRPHSPRK